MVVKSIICRIDESLFKYKLKYHHGRASQKVKVDFWCITDCGFTFSKVCIEMVRDITAITLLPIVSRVCRQD